MYFHLKMNHSSWDGDGASNLNINYISLNFSSIPNAFHFYLRVNQYFGFLISLSYKGISWKLLYWDMLSTRFFFFYSIIKQIFARLFSFKLLNVKYSFIFSGSITTEGSLHFVYGLLSNFGWKMFLPAELEELCLLDLEK